LCSRPLTTQKGVFRIGCPSWIQYSINTQFRNGYYYLYPPSSYFWLSYSKILRQNQPILQCLVKCKKRSPHKLPVIWRLWLYRLFQNLLYTIRKWLLYSHKTYLIRAYPSLHCTHHLSFRLCYKRHTLYYPEEHYLNIDHTF
jgi:hypothetical protein